MVSVALSVTLTSAVAKRLPAAIPASVASVSLWMFNHSPPRASDNRPNDSSISGALSLTPWKNPSKEGLYRLPKGDNQQRPNQ